MKAVQESEEKIVTDKFDSDFKMINDFNDIKEKLADEEKTGSEKVLPVPELTAVEFGGTFEEPGLKVRKDLYKKKGVTKGGFFSESALRFSNLQNQYVVIQITILSLKLE